jgi:hypothetical protein
MTVIDKELEKIIETDYHKNHQGREYDLARVVKIFKHLDLVNYDIFKHGPVLIVHTPLSEDTIEFHCTNGGTSKDLCFAVNEFNRTMSATYTWSVTFYDNPAINKLLKHTAYPCEYEKIDQGIDRTYQAKFSLRRT